jgi:hypothetical protein
MVAYIANILNIVHRFRVFQTHVSESDSVSVFTRFLQHWTPLNWRNGIRNLIHCNSARLPVGTREFSFLDNVQTGFKAHLPSYTMCVGA